MSQQHFTTRRGFIATMGFGAVGLYGAWAAYGAAPLPFSLGTGEHTHSPPEPGPAPGGHGGHGGQGGLPPEDFLQEHQAFLSRFRQQDGTVAPSSPAGALTTAADHGGHGGHGDAHGGHAPSAAPGASRTDEPIDVYLLAYRFGFEPDDLRLEVRQPYRFRMMASDVAHGASLQLGPASRIIRLRPNVVSDQTITFTRPGEYLVYCTVYCGVAHDAMKGRIVVA
jgi:cytochrome c oxidase subunit II